MSDRELLDTLMEAVEILTRTAMEERDLNTDPVIRALADLHMVCCACHLKLSQRKQGATTEDDAKK